MQAAPYGFRIVGSCRETRRLVDATAAFSGYAACIANAQVTREAYLSAFSFGDAFREHLDKTGSTKGYDGPCWSTWLWWDIDREGDLQAAGRDTGRLASSLIERFRLDDDQLLIFFSGSKGFHLGLPTSLLLPELSGRFNEQARQFALDLAGPLGIAIDTGVYDKVRAFRAPNSRHPKTGLYKRRISFDELLSLHASAIVEMATEPQSFELPHAPPQNSTAMLDWQVADERVEHRLNAKRRYRESMNGAAMLNRGTLDFIRKGAESGERHRRIFSAAANLAEFGCPPSLAHALLTEAALDSGLPPKEVRRQINCGVSHAAESTRRRPDDSTEGTNVKSHAG